MDDPRPDRLLEEAGAAAARYRLAIAWSDGITGERAKACSRSGTAAWKAAKPIPADESYAAGLYAKRGRVRNPAVVASASGLVLVECDGDLDELLAKHRLSALPPTVRVRSRRGLHLYYRPPAGRAPLKAQLDESGVIVSSDGYLIGAGALHPSGWVYQYENGADEIAELPAALYDELVSRAAETRERAARTFETGGPILEGSRSETIFHLALEDLRAGKPLHEVLERLLQVNREQCRPPLDAQEVEKQLAGAARWAQTHPTEQERLRAKARAALDEHRARTHRDPAPAASTAKRELLRRPLRQVTPRPVEFLIDNVLPLGTLTLLAGVGGLGKSALSLAYAKQVTDTGRNVLLVSYEDAAEQVLRPRFEALGGNLDLIHELYVDALAGTISFPTDLPELDRHVLETNAVLIVVDPVSASIDLKLDAHKDQDVRVVLGQLEKLAERERLAVLQNAHLNKAPSADPYLRINGSTAFYNASRSVLTVTRDPDEPEMHRLVAHHKSNYGARGDVERWKIVLVPVATEAGPIEVMTMEFVEVAEDVSRDDVLSSARHDKRADAAALIMDELAAGRRPSADVKAAVVAGGVSASTVDRAARQLREDGVLVVEDETTETGRATYWSTAEGSRHTPPHQSDVAPLEPHEQAVSGGHVSV